MIVGDKRLRGFFVTAIASWINVSGDEDGDGDGGYIWKAGVLEQTNTHASNSPFHDAIKRLNADADKESDIAKLLLLSPVGERVQPIGYV